MKLTIKNKEAAAKAMTLKVFKPKLEKHIRECVDFADEAYSLLLKDRADKAVKTGVDKAFLKTSATFLVRAHVPAPVEGNLSRTLTHTLQWPLTDYLSVQDIDFAKYTGYGDEFRPLVAIFPEPKVVPAVFHGDLVIDFVDDKSVEAYAERLIALNRAGAQLAKEAKAYRLDVIGCLLPIKTAKQLEEVFPAAVEYFPKPETKVSLPVPVELINNLTTRLYEDAEQPAA
ncbi:Nmad5 family putative nucleotide modification protein [Marinobacterium jannaschii]|uniref:Nmad5 family putative nucleotide modification protein n=1 Tax=Marinobacterium jannaschii TaxID=64970 RepID=UPI00048134EE|nr:Nmad5 family putative nucleotide modification protein [Marinobacterium jannaschii]